jgi:hypothetical protein
MLARAFCSLRPIVRRTQLDGQPRQSLIQPPREPPSEINVGGVRTSPGVVSWPWTSASRGSPSADLPPWIRLTGSPQAVPAASVALSQQAASSPSAEIESRSAGVTQSRQTIEVALAGSEPWCPMTASHCFLWHYRSRPRGSYLGMHERQGVVVRRRCCLNDKI